MVMNPPVAIPPQAFTCPSCNGAARPNAGVQACSGCGARFSLHAGALGDPATVRPPPHNGARDITVKSAGAFLRKMGQVDPEGVSEGILDPVTGMLPIDQAGVRYVHIYSVAVWRSMDIMQLVVTILLGMPFVVLAFYGVAKAGAFLLVAALPLLLLVVYGVWRSSILKKHMVRVVGWNRTLVIRFDSPLWNRVKFHDELLRRCGITPTPIP
jgi:hypothetical protein